MEPEEGRPAVWGTIGIILPGKAFAALCLPCQLTDIAARRGLGAHRVGENRERGQGETDADHTPLQSGDPLVRLPARQSGAHFAALST